MPASYEKYNVTQYSVSTLLGYIQANDIAIPEIQRPFVWKAWQVRDLIDSLYNGYPTGYLIIWQNPNVRLKDGKDSVGKKVLIDGQQRVTALMTAIAGEQILDGNYNHRTNNSMHLQRFRLHNSRNRGAYELFLRSIQ